MLQCVLVVFFFFLSQLKGGSAVFAPLFNAAPFKKEKGSEIDYPQLSFSPSKAIFGCFFFSSMRSSFSLLCTISRLPFF